MNKLQKVYASLFVFTFVAAFSVFSSSALATVSLIAGNGSAAPVNQVLLNFTWTNSSQLANTTVNSTYWNATANITFNLPAGLKYIISPNATTNMTRGMNNVSQSTTTSVIFGNGTATSGAPISNDTDDTAGWLAFNITANASGTYTITVNETYNINGTSLYKFNNTLTLGITNGTITLTNATFANFTYGSGISPTYNFTGTATSATGGGNVSDNITYTLYVNNALQVTNFSTTGTAGGTGVANYTNGTAVTYTFVFNTSGTSNYSSTSLTSVLTITQGSPTLGITLTPGTSVSYGTATTASSTGCPTVGIADLTCAFTRNGGAVASTDSQRLGIGSYTYTFATGGGANWTSASTSATLSVTAGGGSSGGGGGGAVGGTVVSTPTSTATSTPTVTSTQVQATVTTGQASASIAQITPTTPAIVSIANSDTGVSSVQVSVNNQVNSVNVAINNLNALPSGVSTPQGTLYKELRVDKTNIQDTDIKSVTINFAVQKSWLAANNIDPNTVTLQRYSNGQWNSLPATKQSEDANFVYYSAVSPGLSYFAISGQQVQVTTTTTTAPTPQQPSYTVVIVIIIIVILAVGGYFLMSKKKRR